MTVVAVAQEQALAQQCFAPHRLPASLPMPSVGQRLTLLAFTAISRPHQGQADDAPAAPFGAVPAAAQVWLWGSPCSHLVGTFLLCWQCQPGISHTAELCHHCATSCVPLSRLSSVSHVPSVQHAPRPHSMPGVPVSWHLAGMSACSLGCGLGVWPLQACPRCPWWMCSWATVASCLWQGPGGLCSPRGSGQAGVCSEFWLPSTWPHGQAASFSPRGMGTG